MKKMIVFGLILLCLTSTLFVKIETNPLFELKGVEKVCMVSAKDYGGDNVESVACGNKYFNFCTLKTAKEKIKEISKDVDGIQFYINNTTFKELCRILKIEIVTFSEVDEMMIYCGYTPYYQNCVFLEDKKVNVQIAVKNEQIVAGFPMILTGY